MDLDLTSEDCRSVDRAGGLVQERLHHDPTERWYMQAQCWSGGVSDTRSSIIATLAADERGKSEERHFMRIGRAKDRMIVTLQRPSDTLDRRIT